MLRSLRTSALLPSAHAVLQHLLWCVVVLVVAQIHLPAAQAQDDTQARYTVTLRGVQVEDALEELVRVTRINLVYDPAVLQPARVFCSIRVATAEDHLRCITQEAGLDYYRLSSGTYVVIESAEQEPARGLLRGLVVDGDTGDPLPNAHVILSDASTGAASNGAGAFMMPALLAGPHMVIVSHVGYAPTVAEVWVPPAGEVEHRFQLRPEAMQVTPVVVDGLARRLASEGLGRSSLEADALQAPGGLGTPDVGYQAGQVLGVTTQLPRADLSIQGGDAGEHQVTLDGVPIWSPVSLGRLMGAFSPLAIGQLTVHKAGFGVLEGSQTAGVIDLRHALGTGDRPADARVVVDPLSINARSRTAYRFGNTLKGTLLVAGRRSLWDVRPEPTLENRLEAWNDVDPLLASTLLGSTDAQVLPADHQHGSDVGFSDLHLATRVRYAPYHTTYASFYRGTNRVETNLLTGPMDLGGLSARPQDLTNAFRMLAQEGYDWTNQAAQVRHEWLMGARTFGTVRLRHSAHALHQPSFMDRIPADSSGAAGLRQAVHEGDRNTLQETALEAQVEYSATAGVYLKAQLGTKRTESHVQLDNPFFAAIDYQSTAWRWTGTLGLRVHLGTRWILDTGVRSTYVRQRRRIYTEPRLALRADGDAERIGRYAVRLSTGVYRQFLYPFALSSAGPSAIVPSVQFWTQPDASVAPPKAYHVAAEAMVQPALRWQVNVEGYLKQLQRILALDTPTLLREDVLHTSAQTDFIGTATGHVAGLGLRVSWTGDRTSWTARYAFTESVRSVPGRYGGAELSAPWEEPHQLRLQVQHLFTPSLWTQARVRGVWGRTWGFRTAYYDVLVDHSGQQQFAPFDLNDPEAHQLPAWVRLDLGVGYTHTAGPLSVELRADVLNVLGRANVLDWSLHQPDAATDTFQRTPRLDLPRTPSLSLTLSY